MQYLAHRFNDNTIRFVLLYPGLLDEGILCRAVEAVISRSAVLHSAYLGEERHPYWQVSGHYGPGDYFALVETEAPVSAALAAALDPVEAQGPVKLLCTLARSARESALCVSISHLCVDGSDGKYLLGKIAWAYESIRETGTAGDLTIKGGRRDPEQVYDLLEREEIRSLLRSPMTGIKSMVPLPGQGPGTRHLLHRTVPAPVMTAARSRAKALGATANDLLLAACYCAYAALPEVDPASPMSVMSMMDLRRHCPGGDTQGLCNLTGSLPTKLERGVEGGFVPVLQDLARQTAELKADPYAGLEGMPLLHGAVRRIPLSLLRHVSDRVYSNMALGLTNLGNIPCDQLVMGGLRPTGGWFGGPMKKKPSVQVGAAGFEGACALTIAGEFTGEDAVLLQSLLDGMAQELETFARE